MKKNALFLFALSVTFGLGCSQLSADWRVGTARSRITPEKRLWMSGYAARDHVAEGAVHPLWAKTVVIEDSRGERLVIVTVDLIGDEFGRGLLESVATRVHRRTGIERRQIILNASHTHCGPVTGVTDGAMVTYALDAQGRADVSAYNGFLQDKLVATIVEAAGELRGAKLAYGVSTATFGENRRGQINPDGPVNHSVPILRICDENDQPFCVLFGYACHSATLGGDFYRYNGDFPGFAQIALEKSLPDTMAMFVAGCGADINPFPRGSLALAQQHGQTLAQAVARVSVSEFQAVEGRLKVAFERVDLPFVDPPTKEELIARRGRGNDYQQRLTEVLLERLSRQESLETAYPCPVHVVRFGDDLTLVALGGEVVVDYSLRLQQEFSGQQIWVAGYCDEVFAYVPSERVLAEGGYEAAGAMPYFGWHGPFQKGVEQRVVDSVKRMITQR